MRLILFQLQRLHNDVYMYIRRMFKRFSKFLLLRCVSIREKRSIRFICLNTARKTLNSNESLSRTRIFTIILTFLKKISVKRRTENGLNI